jgi:Protein kinase domain
LGFPLLMSSLAAACPVGGAVREDGGGWLARRGGVVGVGDSGDRGFVVSFAAGSRVAGYRLEEELGRGGMAVVFRARDDRLGRLVALKILAPSLAADEGFRQRFIRESRAAAAVDDPHIVPVFEAGESDGVLFIAMRYVRGGDVRSLVRREGPMPPGRAAEIISPVASALDAAHAAGLLHRDVKPANMLLDVVPGRPDHVYLSDFGLSKAAGASTGLTGAGQFLGTLDYISPEQVQGGPVDGRADQYALACSAFELLTGGPPFRRDQALALMHAQLLDPPPKLTSRRPDLPVAADAVLDRALAKAAQQRYDSCRDFAEALRGAFGLLPYDSGPRLTPPVAYPPTQVADPAAAAAAGTVGSEAAGGRAAAGAVAGGAVAGGAAAGIAGSGAAAGAASAGTAGSGAAGGARAGAGVAAADTASGLADLPTSTGEASIPPVPSGPVIPDHSGRHDGDGGRPGRGRRRRRVGIAAAVAVAAVLAVVAVVLLLPGPGPKPKPRPVPVFSPVAAKSAFVPVSGDVFVYYRQGNQSKAELSGDITHVTKGEVAQLYAQQFPYNRAPVPVGSVLLHPAGKTAGYTFPVAPVLATRYRVEVFGSSTATTPLASSATRTVYVDIESTPHGNPPACARPVCHDSFRYRVPVPSPALSAVMSETVYAYFNINLSTGKVPAAPTVLHLDAGDPQVTAPQRASADEYEFTITYVFRVGNDAYNWSSTWCTKDIEATDGIGLPGHHGCGDPSVPAAANYLG